MTWVTSELMLFGAFFAAYFLLRAGTTTWPPTGVHLDLSYATVFTVLLVSSSASMQLGARAAARGDRVALIRWVGLTGLLGMAFLTNQIREYATSSFSWSDHAYGSVYWASTGLHTMHVFAGLLMMLLLVTRTVRRTVRPPQRRMVEAITYYWHFVDAVWVGLFITIFLVQ